MLVKKFKKKDTYQKVIEYYSNKCDTVMFVLNKDGFDEEELQELNNLKEKIEEKFKNSFIKSVHRLTWVNHECGYERQRGLSLRDFTNQFTIYYYKFTEELKDYLLSNKNIYTWLNPDYPEDISFFKDGYCLFYSVIHEEIVELEIRSKEEYKYFKSIGVEFYDEYYESKDLYYEKI